VTLTKVIRNIKRNNSLLITNKVEAWLAKEGDNLGITDTDDLDRLVRLAVGVADNSDRSKRFGASSRGTCERRQVLAYLGLPVARLRDPSLQNIFNDGTFRHIRWQLMGMAAGVFTDVEVKMKLDDWRLGISMDAINEDELWVFELKGARYLPMSEADISEAHMLQMHTYLFATGWDRAVYLVEDKATQQWKEIVVRRNNAYVDKVRRELERLNEAVEEEVLPPVLPECAVRKGEYKKCVYGPWCVKHAAEGDTWLGNGSWEDDD
jgi:hypothetical protein